MYYKTKKSHKIILFIFTSLFSLCSLNAKSKNTQEEKVYKKFVHPRIYHLDFTDAENQFVLKYDSDSKKYKSELDFSKLIKSDTPKSGDKIIFYFDGFAKSDCSSLYAGINESDYVLVFESLKKNKKNTAEISFLLKEDLGETLILKLYSVTDSENPKFKDISFKLKRVVKSTDTEIEKKEEENAINNNYTIEEVVTEVLNKEDLEKLENEAAIKRAEDIRLEMQRQNEEKAKKEKLIEEENRKKAEEEAARLEAEKAEKLRIEEEKKRNQELLEEQQRQEQLLMEQALKDIEKDSVQRYEKEFLNDYIVRDKIVIDEKEQDDITVISNPDESDDFGTTLLMAAAKDGNDWQLKTLLNSGANVNLKDNDGWTALMYAVRYQASLTCVKLLVNSGAEIKTLNNFGSSALVMAAAYNNNPEVLSLLLSYYEISEQEVLKAFIMNITENNSSEFIALSKVKVFLDKSVPVNSFYEGKTPLMYAAQYSNSTKLIKLLLDNSAVTTLRSQDGKTAFDYAKENKKLKKDNIYWSLNI